MGSPIVSALRCPACVSEKGVQLLHSDSLAQKPALHIRQRGPMYGFVTLMPSGSVAGRPRLRWVTPDVRAPCRSWPLAFLRRRDVPRPSFRPRESGGGGPPARAVEGASAATHILNRKFDRQSARPLHRLRRSPSPAAAGEEKEFVLATLPPRSLSLPACGGGSGRGPLRRASRSASTPPLAPTPTPPPQAGRGTWRASSRVGR